MHAAANYHGLLNIFGLDSVELAQVLHCLNRGVDELASRPGFEPMNLKHREINTQLIDESLPIRLDADISFINAIATFNAVFRADQASLSE